MRLQPLNLVVLFVVVLATVTGEEQECAASKASIVKLETTINTLTEEKERLTLRVSSLETDLVRATEAQQEQDGSELRQALDKVAALGKEVDEKKNEIEKLHQSLASKTLQLKEYETGLQQAKQDSERHLQHLEQVKQAQKESEGEQVKQLQQELSSMKSQVQNLTETLALAQTSLNVKAWLSDTFDVWVAQSQQLMTDGKWHEIYTRQIRDPIQANWGPMWLQARATLDPMWLQARAQLDPLLQQAQEKLDPLVQQAREQLDPLLVQAQPHVDKWSPVVLETRALATDLGQHLMGKVALAQTMLNQTLIDSYGLTPTKASWIVYGVMALVGLPLIIYAVPRVLAWCCWLVCCCGCCGCARSKPAPKRPKRKQE